jgi:hypothetical protein
MTREHFSATTPTHEDEAAPNTVLQAIKKGVAVAALMPAAVIGVTGCSSSESSAPTTANSEGWTDVYGDSSRVEKRCDGPNIVYRDNNPGGGLSVVPNSPECTGKTPEHAAGAATPDLATAIPTPLPTHE